MELQVDAVEVAVVVEVCSISFFIIIYFIVLIIYESV